MQCSSFSCMGWCVVVWLGVHPSGLLVPLDVEMDLCSFVLSTSPFSRTAVSSWRNEWQFLRAAGIWFIKEPSRNEAKSGVFNCIRTLACSIMRAGNVCSMLRAGVYLQSPRCSSELSTAWSHQSCNLHHFPQSFNSLRYLKAGLRIKHRTQILVDWSRLL